MNNHPNDDPSSEETSPAGETTDDTVVVTDAPELPDTDAKEETRAGSAKQVPAEQSEPSEPAPKVKRGLSGIRLVVVIAIVAVLSLAAGVLLMQFIVSPAELAAKTEAPEPGPVTALVEERVISNTVVSRGEVTYADSVEVTIDTSFAEGRPIVTGQVPEVGAIFEAGSVALEITGRPVIVLPGELPSYRTLSIGMSGPDVLQLKQALSNLGFWAGDLNSNVYEWDTATAVGELYAWVGYQPETGGPQAQEALRQAQGSVRAADTALTRAYANWNEIAAQEGADLSVANAEIQEAKAQQSDAYDVLAEAERGVLPTLPSGEVLYLQSLPRRVDDVYVARGDEVKGAVMAVSGAQLTISGTISEQDAKLLEVGMTANYISPDGEELQATISAIEAPKSGSTGEEGGTGGDGSTGGRYKLILDPGDLTEEQISALRGNNVRITIPVASTDGAVIAVPLAALSAGVGGGNLVELLVPTTADPFATEMVEVTAGLAADGFVEISSSDSRISEGSKVVVGR